MDVERKFLLPGESAFARNETLINTLLGSCVAVCIYDSKNRWGGMNHYMLPHHQEGKLTPGKFGDFSINALIKVALSAGSEKRDLEASIYGGGNVVGHLGSALVTGVSDVGDRNIALAKKVLKEYNIPILRNDTGGNNGRRIEMNSASNEISVRTIQRSQEMSERESKRTAFRGRCVRVLIVDDSSTVRKLLRDGLSRSEGLEVVGEAADPYEAREKILALDPDVLCLDVIMPRLDGLSFLKKIMQYKPIPTVIVSTIAKRGSDMANRLSAAGAVHIVDKDELEIYKSPEIVEKVLATKLRDAAMAVMPVVSAVKTT